MLLVFGHYPQPGLRTPDSLFSFNYNNDVDCRTERGYYRTQATIAPLGESLNITINNSTGSKYNVCGLPYDSINPLCTTPTPSQSVHDFGPCCNLAAADSMKKGLFSSNDTNAALLALWEHANIVHLANALGATNTLPAWPGTEFDDSIYALYFDAVTQDFIKIDTNLAQGMVWVGPTNPRTEAYNFGPGEKPGVN